MARPKRPSDLLGKILREARTRSTRQETADALATALGPELASHCRVAGMSAGRLVVEVDSAPLYAELRGFRRDQIRDAMNETLGGRKLTEITFRPGRAGHV